MDIECEDIDKNGILLGKLVLSPTVMASLSSILPSSGTSTSTSAVVSSRAQPFALLLLERGLAQVDRYNMFLYGLSITYIVDD